MSSKTPMPVEEYLKTSFDGPEPDYLDGEIVERRLGSIPHSEAQARMLWFLRSLTQSHSLFAYPELSLRISARRYRVADIAAFVGRPAGTYPDSPPLVAVEIVSEDVRHVEIVTKLAEYHTWGVKHVWSADPWTGVLCRGYSAVTTYRGGA